MHPSHMMMLMTFVFSSNKYEVWIRGKLWQTFTFYLICSVRSGALETMADSTRCRTVLKILGAKPKNNKSAEWRLVCSFHSSTASSLQLNQGSYHHETSTAYWLGVPNSSGWTSACFGLVHWQTGITWQAWCYIKPVSQEMIALACCLPL